MTQAEVKEATAVLNVVLDALMATLSGLRGKPLWQAKGAIGALSASAPAAIAQAQVGAPLTNCFELCRVAGASRAGMDAVVQAITAIPRFIGIPAVVIALGAVLLALVQESKIVLALTFTSRADVDAIMATMNDAFTVPEELAADMIQDPSVYQAIVATHAILMQFLVAEARPLPQMVDYQFNRRMPSLRLAQRLYHDPTRADQLVAENKTVHPLFVQAAGRCLST